MLDVVERLAWMKNSVAWHYHTKHLGGTGVHVPHGSGDGFRGSRRSTVQRVQKAMFPLHSWRRLQMQSQSEDKYKRSYLYSVEKENK